MSPEPEFLTVEDVLQIHDEQLAAYGGAPGVRDQALLESAVGTPKASFGGAYLHEDLWKFRLGGIQHSSSPPTIRKYSQTLLCRNSELRS
jgi:death-on-curing protein